MKKTYTLILSLCLALSLSACDNAAAEPAAASITTSENAADTTAAQTVQTDIPDVREGNADTSDKNVIKLNGGSAESDSKKVSISGSTVTITGKGKFVVSGTLENGTITVDADKSEKVELILNGADITSQTSAAIYVKQADRLTITLAEGSVNRLSNGGSFTDSDDNIDAAIFSKDDLTLDGSGTLSVSSPAGHGIVTKDDLKIKDGSYIISAAKHGLSANDSIEAKGGSFDITSGKDGLNCGNDEENHGAVTVSGGSFRISAGDDGIHSDGTLSVSGGNINIVKSCEGLEALNIDISGGEISIVSSDDGINASDGSGQNDFGGGFGGFGGHGKSDRENGKSDNFDKNAEIPEPPSGEFPSGEPPAGDFPAGDFPAGNFPDMSSDSSSSVQPSVNISGGVIYVNADGDGVDSNGTITVSGGAIYVSGPTNSGNGAIDYENTGTITGGTVIAAGAAGMAQNFSSASQGSVFLNTGRQEAGSTVRITDANGNVLAEYTPEKVYESVVISCPELKVGSIYTVTAGAFSQEITLETEIYGEGFGGFGNFGGFGGGKGDFGGGRKGRGGNI